MKVAVCVGGLVYPESYSLMMKLQKKFPKYDFFYGVWDGRENDTSKKLNAWVFKEPEPEYHPYFDVDIDGMPEKIKMIRKKLKAHPEMSMIAKAYHQTKQILIHSNMLELLPEEYDMIIRTRYDIDLIDDSIDFESLVTDSYDNNHAIGFSKRFNVHPHMFNPKNSPKFHQWWEGFLMDMIIFHPRELFNKEIMLSLHQQQKLLAAEFGWYQVLSQPYGSTHQNYFCNIHATTRDGL